MGFIGQSLTFDKPLLSHRNLPRPMQKILSNGNWIDSGFNSGSFHAFNPATREALTERSFPTSSWQEIESLIHAGHDAAQAMLDIPANQVAGFLETYASNIDAKNEKLADIAHLETGLPQSPRLKEVEIPRTVRQLRQAAASARSGDWTSPTIDTANNIRSLRGPIGGPVVVFGPNNFPFAYNGTAGCDFASAIAAGNPVIAKAHPAHPYTTQLLAELAHAAALEHQLPDATIQLFYDTDSENGLKLAAHPKVGAVGFTGSRRAGLALKAAADRAGTPIYLEMSSVNPVFVLPGSLRERWKEIACELHASSTQGSGQFCTKPGLIILQMSGEVEAFLDTLESAFAETPTGILLTQSGEETVAITVEQLSEAGATIRAGGDVSTTPHFGFPPTLATASAEQFLKNPGALQSEAFGPVCLVVVATAEEEVLAIAEHLDGNLTGSIYSCSEGSDDMFYQKLSKILRSKVGRLLNDKVPTGVTVCPAMNHGGPYPATGHPGFTAVGFPASIARFSALQCYDHVRHDRLPPSIQDKNPSGTLFRLIDGNFTTADVQRTV